MIRLIPALAAFAATSLYLASVATAAESIPGSHPHRGGGRHHGTSAAPVSATTPDLKGTSREEADKEYRKKYGF